MRKLNVLERDLIFAFENRAPETVHFLDTATGEIIPVFEFNKAKITEMMEKEKTRYVKINPISPLKGLKIMRDFTETVKDIKLKEELKASLKKRNPFRNFKEILSSHLIEKERFRLYQKNRIIEEIKQWFSKIGIEIELLNH